jgi:hypothetical protein
MALVGLAALWMETRRRTGSPLVFWTVMGLGKRRM